MSTPKVTWFPRSDIVVSHCNPEMADVSNPRGEILDEQWYCVGELSDGQRFMCNFTWDADEACEKAQWLQDNDIDIDDSMQATYPAYGSRAYMEDSWDMEERW